METNEPKVVRNYAKYVFLDVVKFSKRSAEAQSDIVNQLNTIVRETLAKHGVREEDSILIPTGDGMCIAVFSPHLPYDVHIQMALTILDLLQSHNVATENESRQFQVRIGINQNTDILVTDVNGRRNIAGAGINMASRIMDKADGNQILVSYTVYDELQPSEYYMDSFREFEAEAKHGVKFRVYQFIDESHTGLDSSPPTEFIQINPPEVKLPKIVAFYFAQALKLKEFIVNTQGHGQNDFSLAVMLWFLATDSQGESEATDIAPYTPILHGQGNKDLREVYKYYNSQDFRVIHSLTTFILMQLRPFKNYLDAGGYTYILLFVNDKGKEKLRNDWPNIWDDFSLNEIL